MSKCAIKEFKEIKVGLIINWNMHNGELYKLKDIQKIVDIGKEYPVVVQIDESTKVLVKSEEELDFLDEPETLYSYGMTKQDYLDDEHEYSDEYYKDKIAYILTSDNIIEIE